MGKLEPTIDKEIWRPVIGYEGYYEVSNYGQVKRIDHHKGVVTGRILRPCETYKGYFEVSLYDGHNHKKNKQIHRLVAMAFIGLPPINRQEIRHLDGNPKNNYINNLAWGNNADNKLDILRHGRSLANKNPKKGLEHPENKLTITDIKEIKKLLPILSQMKIAKLFKISQSLVSCIKRNIHWSEKYIND
jgi:hypothetical protein